MFPPLFEALRRRASLFRCALIVLVWVGASACHGPSRTSGLARSITFHASFDHGVNADWSKGDPLCYHAPHLNPPRLGPPGLPAHGAVRRVESGGKFGAALRWDRKVEDMVYFQGRSNVNYHPTHWDGSVSVWLKLDPDRDLAPGFADPLQITPRSWNDASFFVDFSKDERPRHFRLGMFADRAVWDPKQADFDKLPPEGRPMITLTHPPFSADSWTHVVFTWERYNTGHEDGIARLYMNGRLAGELKGWNQKFTWASEDVRIMLGLGYVGWLDELSLFDRALAPGEIQELFNRTTSLSEILP